MRSKRAIIISGGLVLSSLVALILIQIILSAVPQPPHLFSGKVTVGGEPAKDGLEIRVGVKEQNKLLALELTPKSFNKTRNGGFGETAFFEVRADDGDTPERDGARQDDRLFFFLVTGDGSGFALTRKPFVFSPNNDAAIELRARSQQFAKDVPLSVDIVVKPNGRRVTAVDAFLRFNTGTLEVLSIQAGSALTDDIISTFDNSLGTADYSASVVPQVAPTAEFVLATVVFRPRNLVATEDIRFDLTRPNQVFAFGDPGNPPVPVLKSVADLELVRLVEAATSVSPVLFENGGLTRVSLSIFGAPSNIRCTDCVKPENFSKTSTPTFQWDPPPGDVLSFETRALPDQPLFADIGNVTILSGVAVPDGPHTFQVRAVDTGDRKDAIGSLDFFTDTVPPTDPTNLVEQNPGDEGRTRVFTWTRSTDPGFPDTGSGVDLYNIRIRGPQNLDLTAIDSAICVADLCAFTTPELRTGTYTYQVSAVDRATNESGFTPSLQFFAGVRENVQNLQVLDRVGEPALVDTVNTSAPRFQWNPPLVLPDTGDLVQGGIATYEVSITGDINAATPFTMIQFTPFTGNNFSVECSGSVTGTGDDCIKAISTSDEIRITVISVPGLPGGVPDGTHRLLVRVVPNGGVPGQSETVDFTVDTIAPGAPNFISPVGEITDTTPDFVWTKVSDPNGVTYTLEIATGDQPASGDFVNPVFRRVGLTGDDPSVVISGDRIIFTLPEADALAFFLEFKWHVQAVDRALDIGDFSQLATFTIVPDVELSSPVLIAPPDKALLLDDPATLEVDERTRPTFVWQKPSTGDPTSYQLQVVRSGDKFVGPSPPFVINQKVLAPETQFQVASGDELVDTQYRWRVQATDGRSTTTSKENRSFKVDTAPPGVPANLQAVTTGENQRQIVASWDRSVDPVPATGVIGDESGVDFYTVLVTRVVDQAEIESGIVSDTGTFCDPVTSRCEFTSKPLSSALYAVKVQAVDVAANTGDFTPPVEVRAGPLESPFNVIQSAPLDVNNPNFQWQPPPQLPDAGDAEGGIDFYEVAITGDLATADFPFIVPLVFTPYTDTEFFRIECLNSTGDNIACGTAINPLDRIRLKVQGPLPFTLPGKKHEFLVRVVDKLGNPGPEQSFEGGFEVKKLVDLRVESNRDFVGPGTVFTGEVRLVPNGQSVSAVDVFLNFITSDLQVVDVRPGPGTISGLEFPLRSTFDNTRGTVEFSRATFEDPPDTGDIIFAVVTFRAKQPTLVQQPTAISFNATFPRLTEAAFKGVPLVRNQPAAVVTILKPVVNLRLRNDQIGGTDGFARDTNLEVIVSVEPNGQDIGAVDVLLAFDTKTLEAVGVTRAGNMDQVIVNRIDKTRGEIDFVGIITGGTTGDFDLAVATFRTLKATQSLSVGFDEQFPRKTEAAFRGVSVIRDAIGFRGALALELKLNTFTSPFNAEVTIKVRPNGNRVSTVDAFLDFTFEQLDVVGIDPGRSLEKVLNRGFNDDDVPGTADYSATTLNAPLIAEFVLATLDMRLDRLSTADKIDFQTEFPRKTRVAFDGVDITAGKIDLQTEFPTNTQVAFDGAGNTADRLRLVGVTTEAVPPGDLPNLEKRTANFDNTPTFRWDPPIKRPVAGIRTFEVDISGTVPGQIGVTGDVTQKGIFECFDALNFPIPDCTDVIVTNLERITFVEFTPSVELEDGIYSFTVSAIDNLGQIGDATTFAPRKGPPQFIIDTAPPSVPEPIGALSTADTFTNLTQPPLEWKTAVDGLTPTGDLTYDVEVAASAATDSDGNFISPVAFATVKSLTWVVEPALAPNQTYYWHVRALDDAGLAGLAPEEPGSESPSPAAAQQAGALSGRGNASDFSAATSFTVDQIPPAPPTGLKSISTGGNITNDPTTTFEWERSKDNFAVDRYDIAITRLAAGDISGQVEDESCDLLTGLCTFTVSSDDAFGGAENGFHTITVTAVDEAGNTGENSLVFFVDTVAPDRPGTADLVGQAPGDVGIDATFEWAIATDPGFPGAGSGVDSYVVNITPGDITGSVLDADCTAGLCQFIAKDLTDGRYSINVIAVDVATNESDPSIGTEFVGQADKPLNLEQLAPKFAANPVFRWIGPETSPQGVKTYQVATGDIAGPPFTGDDFVDFRDTGLFECEIATGAFGPCTKPPTTADTITMRFKNQLADARYRFGVRVVDNTDFPGPVSVIPFNVDTTPPDAPAFLEVDAVEFDNPLVRTGDRTPTFTWPTATADAISGFDRYELTITADQLQKLFVTGDGRAIIEFTVPRADSLADGRYTAQVRSVDVAGNKSVLSEATTVVFVQDLDAPTTPGTPVKTTELDSVKDPEFAWQASTDDGIGLKFYRVHIESVDLVDTSVPGAPKSISPVTGEFVKAGDVTFTWGEVLSDTTVTYTLEVDRAAGDFTDPVFSRSNIEDEDQATVREVEFTASIPATGDHKWRVRASDDGRNVGPFSVAQVFTVVVDDAPPPAPELKAPVDESLSQDRTPTFRWTQVTDPVEDPPSSGGVTYTLEIARGVQNFNVQALLKAGLTGDDVTVVSSGDLQLVEFTLSDADALAVGSYIWHVKAVDRVGNLGAFSDSDTFTVQLDTVTGRPPTGDTPTPLFPTAGITADGATPTFGWTPVFDINGVTYTLEIAIGFLTTGDGVATGDGVVTGDRVVTGDFASPEAFRLEGITDIEFTISVNDTLNPGLHIWRVQAVDGADPQNRSPFAGDTFVVPVDDVPPDVPTGLQLSVDTLPGTGDLTSGDQTNDTTPTFRWTAVADRSGVTYDLQVSTSSGDEFNNFLVAAASEQGILQASFTLRDPLVQEVKTPVRFFWRVQARDGIDNQSGFSVESTFELDATAPGVPPGLTTKLLGPATTGGAYAPIFTWNSDPDVDRYQVSLDDEPFVEVGTDDTFTTGDVEFGVHHIFRVKALDTFGNESLAALFFSDSTTGDEAAPITFQVAPEDFLPLGAHNIRVRAQDRLEHISDPSQLRFDITELVLSLLLSSPTVNESSNVSMRVQIDPKGLAVDEVDVFINFDPARLQFTGISSGDVITGDAEVRPASGDLIIGETAGEIDFRASFERRTSRGDLVIVVFKANPVASDTSTTIEFETTGDRTAEARLTEENRTLVAIFEDATLTVKNVVAGPGPGAIINQPPVANAGPNQTVNEGATVTFNGTNSTDFDGTIVSFEWDFGDGQVGAGPQPSHVYTDDDGSPFTVTLTATDEDGASDDDTLTVIVNNVAPTIIGVVADPSAVLEGGSTNITVNASDAAGDIDDLLFSFDCDGNGVFEVEAGSSNSTTCTYTDGPATVTVKVKVDDQDGAVTDGEVTVTVNNAAPTVAAGADATIDEGRTFLSAGSFSDPGPDTWTATVDFGDGTGVQDLGLLGTSFTLKHVYADDGPFTVTVAVTDDDGDAGSGDLVVTVTNIAPRVVPGDNQAADEGETITISPAFSDAGTDDTHSATISWGDGTPDTTLPGPLASPFSASHAYGDDGTFTVLIRVIDDEGGVGSGDLEVETRNVAPVVDAGLDVAPFVGEEIEFTGSFTDAGTDDTHSATISWGDGTPDTTLPGPLESPVSATHVYGSPGTFSVTLEVTDDDDGLGVDTLEAVALVAVATIEGLEISPLILSTATPVPPEPVEVTFTVTNITGAVINFAIPVFVNGVVDFTFPPRAFPSNSSSTLIHRILRSVEGLFAIQITDQVAVFNIEPPEIIISPVTVRPRIAAEGNVIAISAIVTNAGGIAVDELINISIDGDTFFGRVRLTPGSSTTVVRLVTVSAPLSGEDRPGRHKVDIGGQKSTYFIVRPVLDVPIPTKVDCKPDLAPLDAQGRPLKIAPGGQCGFGPGSITFSIPVLATPDVQVSRFEDTASGVSVIGKNVELPIKDPVSGETLIRFVGELEEALKGTVTGDAATGTFSSLKLLSEEKREDLTADDPLVGELAVSFDASLEQLPEGVNMALTIKKQLSDEDRTKVELTARELEDAKVVADEAGTVTVQTRNLATDDVGAVQITIKVSPNWISQFGARNVRLAHVDAQGQVQLLETVCTGDRVEVFPGFFITIVDTCVGTSPGGFSEFSLLAVDSLPADFVASNLIIEPKVAEPGETVKISVDIANEGALIGSFSAILKIRRSGELDFEPIAVQEITLAAGSEGRIQFFVQRAEQGEYKVDIEGLPGTFEVFKKVQPADLRFSDLTVFRGSVLILSGETVEPGDTLTIRMLVRNVGQEDGRTEFALRINSALSQILSKVVPFGPDGVIVEFDFLVPAEGTFSIELIEFDQVVPPLVRDIVAVAPVEAARFNFGTLDVSPREAKPEEQVTITFQISNLGGQAGTFTVDLLLNGQRVDSQDVTRDPLFGAPVTFTINAPSEAGTYTLRVAAPDDPSVAAQELQFTVVSIEGVRIQRLTVPASVVSGEDVIVSVDVENPVDDVRRRTLELTLDGQFFEEKIVELQPGESQTVTFTIPNPAVGTHIVVVAGILEQTFEVRPVIVPAVLSLEVPLTVSPAVVQPGVTVRISAVVRNDGEQAGTTDVVLRINGVVEQTTTVSVPGGDQKVVIFDVSRDADGDYAVELEAERLVLKGSFTVTPVPGLAKLVIVPGTLELEEATVAPGESLRVSVTVRNEGGAAGDLILTLSVDGEEIEVRTVTLGPGDSQLVDFFLEESVEGTHTVDVNGITADFTVTEPGGLGVIPILLLIILALVVIGGAAFLYYRKTKATSGTSPAGTV